ncbi:alcohol dehydrogenase [Cnuibacter physcomitrellae]|uniref:alcohol dehydrogenase n=1 Tax=Cnuibacter physcomitrellae TaxID=1619308 RepID=UPI002175F045|nr:alcohol dehydrogenase [Cnuibacter physcomitrellae]MCS5498239.1 alcohol dehydrogenase [Cnuibacter physcomitrellae]
MRVHEVVEFGSPLIEVDQEEPTPQGTEVLVEVISSGVCHTDLHLQDGYYSLGGGKRSNLADRGIVPPLVLGHEVLGRVIAAGPDAGLPAGDGSTFVVYPWLGCGHCAECLRGDENLCATPKSIGVARPGGYAERLLVPHPRYLVPADGLDPDLAATYACSGLTAYSAVTKAAIDRENDLLLIIGLGGVGFNGLLLARALGFQRIAAADIDPGKRALAEALGGVLVLDPSDEGAAGALAEAGGVAAAVDFVGMPTTSAFAVSSLRKGGICIVVGLFGGALALDLPPLVQRSLTVRGSYVGTLDELKQLVELARTGRLQPLPVEQVPFDDVNSALDRLRAGGVAGRLVLTTAAHAEAGR